MGGGAGGAGGALSSSFRCVSRSRLMMRPPGPVPVTLRRSMPSSPAMRAATGDALSRPPGAGAAASAATAAAAAAGAGASAATAGAAGADAAGAGAGFRPNAARSTCSPASPMTPIGVPIGTLWPAVTSTSSSTPLRNAGTSTVALSVSTSKIVSPWVTASPGCFSHSPSLPSAMSKPNLGMVIVSATDSSSAKTAYHLSP